MGTLLGVHSIVPWLVPWKNHYLGPNILEGHFLQPPYWNNIQV